MPQYPAISALQDSWEMIHPLVLLPLAFTDATDADTAVRDLQITVGLRSGEKIQRYLGEGFRRNLTMETWEVGAAPTAAQILGRDFILHTPLATSRGTVGVGGFHLRQSRSQTDASASHWDAESRPFDLAIEMKTPGHRGSAIQKAAAHGRTELSPQKRIDVRLSTMSPCWRLLEFFGT